MKSYLKKHRRLLGIVGAVISFCIATIYIKVIPEEASSTSGLSKIILSYGHSACWILLGSASVLWVANKNRLPGILTCSALAMYILFICTLVLAK